VLEPLRIRVIVESRNKTGRLLKDNVVEARKRSTRNSPYSVIGDQKVLLPAHKDIVGRAPIVDVLVII
jgi:hypothetical protein